MRVSDFSYELPEELIAQSPIEPRDHSRLLVVDRSSGNLRDKRFYDIVEYLRSGDLMVVNNTRVIPARLFGTREGTGGKVEILLLRRLEPDVWECLARPGRKVRVGERIRFEPGIVGLVEARDEEGLRHIRFQCDGRFDELLDQAGVVPLPPYIRERLSDPERYQTVYSAEKGSVAAPTAGLHFTDELLSKIRRMGVEIAEVTLHVGIGTFRPVMVENVADHRMHSESYHISTRAADAINSAKSQGRRVIAVGTTSVRALEAAWDRDRHQLRSGSGETSIFIYPGFHFGVVDALITNFHLPKSTLLMLVSAFAGTDLIKRAYEYAVESRYRFFSFGDAMFIY